MHRGENQFCAKGCLSWTIKVIKILLWSATLIRSQLYFSRVEKAIALYCTQSWVNESDRYDFINKLHNYRISAMVLLWGLNHNLPPLSLLSLASSLPHIDIFWEKKNYGRLLRSAVASDRALRLTLRLWSFWKSTGSVISLLSVSRILPWILAIISSWFFSRWLLIILSFYPWGYMQYHFCIRAQV